jgi:hypothetical protein
VVTEDNLTQTRKTFGMKLLKKRKIVINPECIYHIWSNPDSSKVSAYLSCSGEEA